MSFGFVIGMVLAAFIYREAPSLLARALKTCTQGYILSDSALDLSYREPTEETRIVYLISS